MPLYDYDCAACGRRFEVIHGLHADPPSSCPLCGSGPVRKAFAAPAIHFKGSGWAKKERRAGTRTEAGSAAGAEAAGESGESDEVGAGAGAASASGDGAAEGAGGSGSAGGSGGSGGSTKKPTTISSTSGSSSKASGPSD